MTAMPAAKNDISSLGKKSTALDVLETLNKSDNLASYINLDKEDDLPVAVVTGGNSGIGIPSIEALALANMKVVLCARNLESAKDAVESLRLPSSLQANIRIQKLDLSDMASIEAAAEEILETEGKVDVLLNNAGVMATPKRESTSQGLELQFGTNHVGHHMFTRKLLPKMNNEGRVVTVASTAHTFGQLSFSNLNYDDDKPERSYTAWGAYGQSKLANVLFAKGLDDKLKDEGSSITSLSLHPGVIGTNLWRYTPKWTKPFLNALVADRSIDQGAATNVYGCLADKSMFNGGEYLKDCAIAEPNQYGKDENKTLRKKLWDATEEIIKKNEFQLSESLVATKEMAK